MPARFMRFLAVTEDATESVALAEAAAVLSAGGVVAYPTETFYGLAVDPRDPLAVDALFAAKGRDRAQAIPLIAADIEQLEAMAGVLSTAVLVVARHFWPGPLTVVVPAWPGLVEAVHGGTKTVAVRVSGHPVARALARALGHPISSTSANRSGHPPVTSARDVDAQLGASVTLVLDGGETPGGAPSTIINLTGPEPALVREGAVPWSEVLAVLAEGPAL